MGLGVERRGLKVFHKGLILVFTPLLIEIAFVASLAYVLLQLDSESVRETRYRRVAASCAKVVALSNDSIVSILAYIHFGSKQFADVYLLDTKQIQQRLNELPKISHGDALCEKASQQLIDSERDIRPLVDDLFRHAKEGMGGLQAIDAINHTRAKLNEVREKNIERMSSVSKLLEQMAEGSKQRQKSMEHRQAQILRFALAFNIAACLALFVFYRQSIYQRLRAVKLNTLKLAEESPLPAVLKGADEIAALDQAFHEMKLKLKEAAERESSLFQNASDVICVLSEDLRFEKINPACQKLWGKSPAELSGQSLESLISGGSNENERAAFHRAMEKSDASEVELRLSHPNGKFVDTLWSNYYSKQERKLYCIVHDITERKQIEEMKKSFISLMSSDLRLPLSKISADLTELLDNWQAELSAAAYEKLGTVKGNLSRLLRLVNDLLQMVQVSDGKIVSQREEQAIEPLFRQCVEELEGIAKKQQVKFEFSCAASSWFVDQNRIMQVIANLCSNAVKFSPKGGTVQLHAALLDDGFVEVYIADQGRGVPLQFQNSIFEKFKQVEAADGKRKSGTGLGLPICKEIVEEHCGTIGVSSEEGNGSKFWFRIPASRNKFDEVFSQKQVRDAQKEQLRPSLQDTGNVIHLPDRVSLLARTGRGLSLMQKGFLLVGVPLLFELAFVGSIAAVLEQTSKNNIEEFRQRQIASNAYNLHNGYFGVALLGVKTHSIENWRLFDQASSDIIESANKLEKLLAADPVAHAQWDGVNKIHSKFLAKITYCRREYARKGFSKELADEIMPQRFECFTYAVAIRKKLSKIIDDAEQKQFLSPEKQQRLRQIQALLLLIGLGANVAVSWFLARFFSSDITARLAVQADNASRLARDVSLNPVVPGQDEIAQLDSAFHQTAEKLAEARRKERAVFDNSRELICVLDQTGKFLTINPVAEEIFACSREELLEVSLFDYLEEEGKKKAAELLEENISAGKKLELTLQLDDGKLVHMLFSFTREANGGRRMADGDERIYCIGHDISDRKELEQLKQDFLSVVSHDLRTPLTSVNLAANLIEEGATGAVGKNALPLVHDISVQGEQLIELINDLLDLEKLEAKKMELVRAEKEACRLIEPALGVVEERFPDIVFIAKSQKSDARIFGDSERIAQAFTYILSYLAANSAPESDIYVQANEIDGSFRWRITQEGMPLNEAQKAQLFDRFSAADAKGRQSAGQLSILAMPLARSIIEAHGGRIMVETIPDGNSFQIELPLALKEASTS